MSSGKHFHLIVPVWGTEYTSLFSDVCMPMLMTAGNLGVFGQNENDQFVIVTTWLDHLAITNSLSYKRLLNFVRVEFLLVDGIVDISKSHAAMSECYAMAMRRDCVVPGVTYYIFLTPDSFWPDGTFRELVALSQQNIAVAMAGGLRLKSESMTKSLKTRILEAPENPVIPYPALVQLALRNLHQLSDAFNLLSRKGFLTVWPSHMYWVSDQDYQLIAHCFHLHPLMVLAPKSQIKIGTTIDGEFMDNLPYGIDRYQVLNGNFVAFELTPADRDWGQPLEPCSLGCLIRFGIEHANRRHWYFFSHRIVVNGNPEKPVNPIIDQLVNNTVNAILKKKWLAIILRTFKLHHLYFRMHIPRLTRIRKLFRKVLF